jgi:hypothetical protein
MDCEVDEFEENLLDLSKTALKRKLLKSIDDVKRKIAYEISQTSSSSLCSNYSTGAYPAENFYLDGANITSNLSNDDLVSDDDSETDDSSDSDDYESDSEDIETMPALLRDLFTEFNTCSPFVNKLLPILRDAGLTYLPRTYDAFMKTPTNDFIIDDFATDDGLYIHYGLQNELSVLLNSVDTPPVNNLIEININVDGMPIAGSSNSQFWPILGLSNIENNDDPFVIGIYYSATKKPTTTHFMDKFVEEAVDLQQNGFVHEGKIYNVAIKLFICDTPATSFIFCIKGHSGFESCRKCVVFGMTIEHRRCFPDIDCEKRTDGSFRSQKHPGHHVGDSPLLKLNIDMVNNAPLDYMHLVCLGVMKKCLLFWVTGVKKSSGKLHAAQILKLEDNLQDNKSSQPIEFSRRIRSTQQVKHWKATEFRTFILYVGPVVLKDVLDERVYKHFLKLHCSIQIMVRDENLSYLLKAHNFLEEYVLEMLLLKDPLFGHHFVGYNFHNLIHLANDVQLNGKLDNFSSFPYENHLQFLKKRLRGANKPLQQITNRIAEIRAFRLKKKVPANQPRLSWKEQRNNEEYPEIYRKISMKDFVIDDTSKNKWFMTKNKSIFAFSYAIKVNNIIYLCSHQALELQNFYEDVIDFDSRLLNISKSNTFDTNLSYIPLTDFQTKVFGLRTTNDLVFFPL